jgi:ligand-binding sensor domain-containing protein/signal transduction histidine kinase
MSRGLRYLFLAFVLTQSQAKAQLFNLGFDHYNTDSGLSQNEVFDIVQDQKGFIWFGTDEGLNRFDGHEFRIFKNEPNNKNSLIGNSVQSLEIDQQGTLWIGTTNGISRYYPQSEFLEQLHSDPFDPSKPQGTSVREISLHPDGSIWIAYLGNGVDVYDPDEEKFFHYSSERKDQFRIKNNYVTSILFMPNGDRLLGSRAGVLMIDKDGLPQTDATLDLKYPWQSKIDHSINCFQVSRDGKTLWIGTELKGVYEVDLNTNTVVNYNTSNSRLSFNNNVPSLYEDSKGNLWVGGEAIHLLDRKNNDMVPYNEQGVREKLTQKNPILAIYEDRASNIWLGTYRLGVLKYNPGDNQVLHFNSRQGEKSIGNDKVLSFNEDLDGNLWVGTDGNGLYKLVASAAEFELAPMSTAFSSQVIKCIMRDNAGYFWIGTWDGGMMKYHPRWQSIEIYNPEKGNFNSRHVWDIKADSAGNLWVGTLRDGLCYFNPKTKVSKYFRNDPEDTASLINDDVLSLNIDSRNSLWIGTSNGLSVLRKGADKFVNFKAADFPLLTMNVLCIYEDDQQRTWLGTNGGGLIVVDNNLQVIKVIGEKDGLSSSTICDLQTDDHHHVWVSTYNGLFRIDPDDFTVSEVPQFIGLQGREFITHSGFKLAGGKMVFGGANGFNMFHPDSLKFEHDPIEVVFTSLRVSNDEVRPNHPYHGKVIVNESITQAKKINLSHKDYSFTLTFSPLLYSWQNSLHYAYKLEPLDDEWQYTTSQARAIHYTTLDAGEYTLSIKTSFDGRSWSDNVKTLAVVISPPWWATPVFRVSAFIFVASVLVGFYKLRTGFLKAQRARLEELVKIRTSELKQSNEEIQLLLEESATQKKDIQDKNLELSRVNTTLEELVHKRTEKLNQTLLELETFLYRASHDLRGPISSMLGLLRVAALENRKQPQDKYLEFLQNTILKLEKTLDKLMQKHTIQKSILSNEVITREELIRIINKVTADLPYFRPLDFEIKIQENIRFETDEAMFTIILANLLENAFFFSERSSNPKVFLDAAQNENGIVLSILDYGPGINPDVCDKIFTMFFRGHESSTGNGLGLYLVQSALSKINGTIMLDTKSGNYSRFTVTLKHSA